MAGLQPGGKALSGFGNAVRRGDAAEIEALRGGFSAQGGNKLSAGQKSGLL